MVAFPEVQLLRKPDGKAIKLMRGHTHQVYDLLIEALTDLLDDNRLPGATDAQIACMAHNAILEELRRRKSRMTIHEKLEELKREIGQTELYSKARGKLSAPGAGAGRARLPGAAGRGSRCRSARDIGGAAQ